jgi:hypothetical protein
MFTSKRWLCLIVVLYPLFIAAWQSSPIRSEQKVSRVDIDDDDTYSPRLEKPAFQKDGPVVLLDEAHGNQHFDKAFARLMAADGFQIVTSRDELTFDSLSKAKIVVIMNTAMFMPWKWLEAPSPLFSDREAAAIRDWVTSGGSLLYASGSSKNEAGEMLLSRIGIQFQEGHIVDRELTSPDAKHSSSFGGITFNREKNTLANHSILTGRSDSEHVEAVLLNGMRTIRQAPDNAVPLIHYSDKALLLPRDVFLERTLTEEARQLRANGKTETTTEATPLTTPSPAPGKPVAVAFALGKGRVVVIGAGSALSSVVVKKNPPGATPITEKVGLGEADNQKFTLNVMHWLAGLLE